MLDDGKGYDLKSKSVVRMERYSADVSPRFILTGGSRIPEKIGERRMREC